ncbi:MAG: GntR family transcriptional regulator [Planctomycetota bacterium]
MENKTPRQKPKYRVIETELLSMIEDGRVSVGQQVPTEHFISNKYNVSRFTVRKAIENLEHEGYLTRTAGKGTFVADWKKVSETKRMVLRKDIAIVMVDGTPETEVDDSWTVRSLRVASSEAEKSGYHITFCGANHKELVKGNIPLALRDRTVRGAIVDGNLSDEIMEQLLACDVTMIVIGSHCDYGVAVVDHDIEGMTYKITQSLLELDHGPVWYVMDEVRHGQGSNCYMEELYCGYKRGIFECGAEPQMLLANICHASECGHVIGQMVQNGSSKHCVIVGTGGHLREILRHMRREGIAQEDVLFVGIGRYHSAWPLSRDEMMFCDVVPDMVVQEAVRQLIRYGNKEGRIEGRLFKLEVERVADRVKPLRFKWV